MWYAEKLHLLLRQTALTEYENVLAFQKLTLSHLHSNYCYWMSW